MVYSPRLAAGSGINCREHVGRVKTCASSAFSALIRIVTDGLTCPLAATSQSSCSLSLRLPHGEVIQDLVFQAQPECDSMRETEW